jgi:hypothetical protein
MSLLQEIIDNITLYSPNQFYEAMTNFSRLSQDICLKLTEILLNKGYSYYIYFIINTFGCNIEQIFKVISNHKNKSNFIDTTFKSFVPSSKFFQTNSLTNLKIFLSFLKQNEGQDVFKPNYLGLVKKRYNFTENKEEKEILKEIFNYILFHYDNKDYFYDDKHKKYCETLEPLEPSLFPKLFKQTELKIDIPIIKILKGGFYPEIFKSSDSIFKVDRRIRIKSNNFGGGYMQKDTFHFDIDWAYNCMDYLKNLSLKDKFTVYGYTYNGDNYAKIYLMNGPESESFRSYLKAHITPDQNRSITFYSKVYFPLYFQCMEVLNQSDFSINHLHTPINFLSTLKDYYNKNLITESYLLLIKNLNYFKDNFIAAATKIFIDDLQRIIENSPSTINEMILYRGVKDKYFMQDDSQIFINKTFMSTTYDVNTSFEKFAGDSCCVKKIIVKPGTKCLFMESLTQVSYENEVLLGLNNKFKIIETNVTDYLMAGNEEYDDICSSEKRKMDITVMETVNE